MILMLHFPGAFLVLFLNHVSLHFLLAIERSSGLHLLRQTMDCTVLLSMFHSTSFTSLNRPFDRRFDNLFFE